MNEIDIINYINNMHTMINKISEKNISKIIELKNFFSKNSEQTANFCFNLLSYNNALIQSNSFSINFFGNFNNFYSFHENILNEIYYFSSQIKSEIIIPLETIIDDKVNEYKLNLKEIEQIKINMQIHIKNVNTKKEEYYEENKKLKNIENELNYYIDKKDNEKINISLENKKAQILVKENKLYDYEKIVKDCNEIYAIENEKKFNKIFEKIKNNEKNFESFIENIFKIYYDLINNLYENIHNLKKKINDFNKKIENKYYNNFLDFINSNKISNINNWNLFSVIKYEQYLENKKFESKIYDINYIENSSNNIFEIINIDHDNNNNNNDNNNNNNNNIDNNDNNNNIVKDFFSDILSSNKINDSTIQNILSLLDKENNLVFYSNFLSNFNSDSKYLNFKEFHSYNNFINFSAILNKILTNLNTSADITNESYNIILKIIKISESSFFNNNQYLCSIIGLNQIFKLKFLWKNIIFNNLINYLINECNILLNNNENGFEIGKKIGKFFSLINYSNYNNNDNNKSIIIKNNLSKFLCDYKKLSEENIKLLDELCINKLIRIINKFLIHMSNLNVDYEISCNIIKDLCFDFNIDNNNQNYFIMSLKSCELNIRRTLKKNNCNNNNKIKNIINDIKKQSKEFIKNKYPINIINIKEKYLILKNTLDYLPKNIKINLMLLNKELQSKISKKIFKNILYNKNTSLNKHILIWKTLLHSQYYKNKYNYENILKKCKEISKNESDIIELDCKRTNFKNNNEEKQNKLKNILLCLFYIQNSKKIFYHQGINVLSGFLLEIINNEEDVFYLMMGIYDKTKFVEIFENELEKLKCNFEILYKLLLLFLPQIYIQFKKYKIKNNFFSLPYFITLFTNVYGNFKDVENLFLIRVIDDFLLSGWKKIFVNLLTLLKYNQFQINNCNENQLNDYLSNELPKSKIFDNNNFEKYLQMKNEFKTINKKIIKDLEEEIQLKMILKSKNNKINNNDNNNYKF